MKLLSKEELYKRNQKLVKVYKIASPIIFWAFLFAGVLFFVFAIRNSLGNVGEIIEMLNTKTHTGEELAENYALLVAKYGEWVIGNGDKGFQLVFINLQKAVFSGVMQACAVLSVIFTLGAFMLGKWLLPLLAEKTLQENQDMVNLTILKEKE